MSSISRRQFRYKRPEPEEPEKYPKRPPPRRETYERIKAAEERGEKPSPAVTTLPRAGPREQQREEPRTVTLEEAVALGYISKSDAHRMQREYRRFERPGYVQAAYKQAYDEAHRKALEAAGGREVFFDPEKRVFYWYEEQTVIEEDHPIHGHKHLQVDDLSDVLGVGQYADVYKSHSTYVLEPSPPREPHLVQHRHLEVDDLSGVLGVGQYADVYKSRSTYEVGELGSVLAVKAEKLKGKSVETFEEGKPWKGFGEYFTGATLSAGVSFIRGFTYTFNPLEWARGARDITYLAKSKKAQRELLGKVSRDPFSFAFDIGAGVAGGYTAGRLIKFLYDLPESREYIKTETQVARAKVVSQTHRKQYGKTVSDRYGAPLKQRIGLTKDESNILYQKMKGWVKVASKEEPGQHFASMTRISSGSPWPESGTLGFGKVSEMGGRASLMLEHDPLRYIYKPIIETTYGFKKTLLKTPITRTPGRSILSTTRMVQDFTSIMTPGRSLSIWPFLTSGGLISLTKQIPTIDEPIKVSSYVDQMMKQTQSDFAKQARKMETGLIQSPLSDTKLGLTEKTTIKQIEKTMIVQDQDLRLRTKQIQKQKVDLKIDQVLKIDTRTITTQDTDIKLASITGLGLRQAPIHEQTLIQYPVLFRTHKTGFTPIPFNPLHFDPRKGIKRGRGGRGLKEIFEVRVDPLKKGRVSKKKKTKKKTKKHKKKKRRKKK